MVALMLSEKGTLMLLHKEKLMFSEKESLVLLDKEKLTLEALITGKIYLDGIMVLFVAVPLFNVKVEQYPLMFLNVSIASIALEENWHQGKKVVHVNAVVLSSDCSCESLHNVFSMTTLNVVSNFTCVNIKLGNVPIAAI